MLSDGVIAAQRAADPTAAASEWDAEFRTDIGAFLDDELIDAAIARGRPWNFRHLAHVPYRAFIDPSGGVGGDSYSIAIGHKERQNENERYVIDVVRGQEADPQEPGRTGD